MASPLGDLIADKIRRRMEQRQSEAVFDVIRSKIAERQASIGKTPEEIEDFDKKIEKVSNAGFSAEESLRVGKLIAQELFQSEDAMNIKQGNLDMRKMSEQDRIEKYFTDRVTKVLTGAQGAGLQNKKVDSSFHALNILDQSFDPKTKEINLPSYMQAELASNIANTISNQTTNADSMRQDLMAKSIYGDWNKTMQYLLGAPKNSTPEAMFKNLTETVVRQGILSQDLRDEVAGDLKKLVPNNLDPETADRIIQDNLGNDFKGALKNSAVYNHFFNDKKNESNFDSEKEARYQAWKKSQASK